MSVVAIHQPNYAPWLGYFRKIAEADIFIFLDDVQFSKNSYTNRVQILADGEARWLTLAARVRLGDPINGIMPARPDWVRSHLDTLRGFYRAAPAFRSVWPEIERLYSETPVADLAAINRHLVEGLAERLGLRARFRAASELPVGAATGDDRLIALVQAVATGGCYLSGKGGASYQEPEKFRAAGLGFRYLDFRHPRYDQGGTDFVAGLSVLDPIFRLGWSGAASLIAAGAEAA